MERPLLIGSILCFLVGFAHTMYTLGKGIYRPTRFNFIAIFVGFLFQSAFLVNRGNQIGRCPLTNLFEVLIFLSWSIVLIYLLIGSVYRVSLLGTFTSPLVLLIQVIALLAPLDIRRNGGGLPPDPWLELHAAISIIAYGAFALACIAGVMYLSQERQLKTHHLHSIFYHLPPIAELAIINTRLLVVGFGLLTIGVLAGFAIERPDGMGQMDYFIKIGWSVGIWCMYGFMLLARFWKRLSPRKIALFSVVAFCLTLSTLWGLRFITVKGA